MLLNSFVCREVLVECESLPLPLLEGPLRLSELLLLSFSPILLALLFMRKKLRRRLLTWPPAELLATFEDGIAGLGDGDDDDDDGDDEEEEAKDLMT